MSKNYIFNAFYLLAAISLLPSCLKQSSLSSTRTVNKSKEKYQKLSQKYLLEQKIISMKPELDDKELEQKFYDYILAQPIPLTFYVSDMIFKDIEIMKKELKKLDALKFVLEADEEEALKLKQQFNSLIEVLEESTNIVMKSKEYRDELKRRLEDYLYRPQPVVYTTYQYSYY